MLLGTPIRTKGSTDISTVPVISFITTTFILSTNRFLKTGYSSRITILKTTVYIQSRSSFSTDTYTVVVQTVLLAFTVSVPGYANICMIPVSFVNNIRFPSRPYTFFDTSLLIFTLFEKDTRFYTFIDIFSSPETKKSTIPFILIIICWIPITGPVPCPISITG